LCGWGAGVGLGGICNLFFGVKVCGEMGLALGLKQLSLCLLHDGMFRQSGELAEHIHKHSSSCAFVTAVEATAANSVSRGLLREGKLQRMRCGWCQVAARTPTVPVGVPSCLMVHNWHTKAVLTSKHIITSWDVCDVFLGSSSTVQRREATGSYRRAL